MHYPTMNEGKILPSVVALGMFDGMHLGHRKVIAEAVRMARLAGIKSVVYTFENHPRSVYGCAPTLLLTADERRAQMQALGVDLVDMVRFDPNMAGLSPSAFCQALLDRYDMRTVVVGADYTFGHRGQGTVETLRSLGQSMGFTVNEVPFVMLEGQKVSSTRIRAALERGDTELVRRMLGGDA